MSTYHVHLDRVYGRWFNRQMKYGVTVLSFLLVAATASLFRFGQRENELHPTSDSDIYLDMARVFSGAKPEFDERLKAQVKYTAHHYGRPLLPFMAGWLQRLTPASLRASFSLVNILFSFGIALLLWGVLRRIAPDLGIPWAAPVLFLTGFPQLNWGYHILTDTAGLFFALAASLLLIRMDGQNRGANQRGGLRLASGCVLLFVVQACAFLARETAWISVVIAVLLLVRRMVCGRSSWRTAALCLGVLLLAKYPHYLYGIANGTQGVGLDISWSKNLQIAYIFDFIVKSGVAFHIAWIMALWGLWRASMKEIPEFFYLWTIAALAYMGGGYLGNHIGQGYPMRMTYALFPAIFYLSTRVIDIKYSGNRKLLTLAIFMAAHVVISCTGVILDPGRPEIRAIDYIDGAAKTRISAPQQLP